MATRRSTTPRPKRAPIPALDWTDDQARRRFLTALRVALTDADAVTEDMLRPLRRRTLGPAEARRLYRDAADKLATLLTHAEGGTG